MTTDRRPSGNRRGVGRPRDHDLDPLIRAATLELLGRSRGVESFTLDHVAARAKVGKATIYRRWPSKTDLILDAVQAGPPVEFTSADSRSLEGDAAALLARLVRLLASPQGMAARQLVPLLDTWPELAHAYRGGVLIPWWGALDLVATRACTRGDVDDPGGARSALHAAGCTLVAEWMVHPASTDPDGAAGTRVDQLVATLIRPLVAPQRAV